MSNISRNTVPQEFFDLTSTRMLVQPQPAYPLAGLVFAAEAAAELRDTGVSFGMGEPIADDGSGRAAPNHGAAVPQFSSMQLKFNESDMAASEMFVVDRSLAGSSQGVIGHTVKFNRPVFTSSTYTEASRTIDSASALSTTGIAISAEQVNLTIKLVGGPYSSGIKPYALSNFDAQRSLHSQAEFAALNMRQDRWKYLDTVIGLYLTLGSVNVFPNDPTNALTTANGAFNLANDRPMDVETLWRAEEQLDTANWPRFADGTYHALLHPRQIRQLKVDPDYARQAVFMPEFNFLKASYVAQIGKIKIFETTTLPTGTANSTVTYYQGSMFGAQILAYAPAWQCHVRSFAEDNAGLTPKMIWVCGEGHTLVDNRGVCGIWTD